MNAVADVVHRSVDAGTNSSAGMQYSALGLPLLEVMPPPSAPSARKEPVQGMRITFVNRYFYPDLSATSQMLTDLARRLAQQGMQVSIVCSRQLYDDAQATLPEQEVFEGIQIHRVNTSSFGRDRLSGRAIDYLSFYATAMKKLLAITRRGDVLVAKTDPPMISVMVAAVAKLRGARMVNWLQDLFPEVASHLGHKMPGLIERSTLRLRDWSLRAADVNVVIGSRMRDRLLQRRIDAQRIHVIENWSDGDFVAPQLSSASALRVSLGLQHKFVVGYSGNLGRAHDHLTILNAARALRNEKDVVFLMIGGGVNMQRLKAAVAESKLGNFVFLPYQTRELLADSMAAADVHLITLLPQLEGLIVPSKFYGILAAGRPSIFIGDLEGELARSIRREQCGEAVRVGDWDALVSALWHLKLDPEYRKQLGECARSVFLHRHTVEQAAHKWLQLLVGLEQSATRRKGMDAITVGA